MSMNIRTGRNSQRRIVITSLLYVVKAVWTKRAGRSGRVSMDSIRQMIILFQRPGLSLLCAQRGREPAGGGLPAQPIGTDGTLVGMTPSGSRFGMRMAMRLWSTTMASIKSLAVVTSRSTSSSCFWAQSLFNAKPLAEKVGDVLRHLEDLQDKDHLSR